MDGHGQPALLYIVPFTLGKYNLSDSVKSNLQTQDGMLVPGM